MSAGAIEALAPARGRCYRDGVITVRPRSPVAPRRPGGLRTAHFDLLREDGDLVLEHALSLDGVDDDLAGLLSDELFEPGWLRGADLFERVFTGVVLTCDDDPVTAWAAFYENTLRAVDRAAPGDSRSVRQAARPITTMASVSSTWPRSLTMAATTRGSERCMSEPVTPRRWKHDSALGLAYVTTPCASKRTTPSPTRGAPRLGPVTDVCTGNSPRVIMRSRSSAAPL